LFLRCLITGTQEKRIVAPIRCGGVPKSYSKQLLLVGDAAGHVDPLTGEYRFEAGFFFVYLFGSCTCRDVLFY
jgi:hypothetical protein